MFTKEMMDTFTDLDLAVYDCIVKNRGRISRMPIKELAAMAHVSTATILRFCRNAGRTDTVSSSSNTENIWRASGTR